MIVPLIKNKPEYTLTPKDLLVPKEPKKTLKSTIKDIVEHSLSTWNRCNDGAPFLIARNAHKSVNLNYKNGNITGGKVKELFKQKTLHDCVKCIPSFPISEVVITSATTFAISYIFFAVITCLLSTAGVGFAIATLPITLGIVFALGTLLTFIPVTIYAINAKNKFNKLNMLTKKFIKQIDSYNEDELKIIFKPLLKDIFPQFFKTKKPTSKKTNVKKLPESSKKRRIEKLPDEKRLSGHLRYEDVKFNDLSWKTNSFYLHKEKDLTTDLDDSQYWQTNPKPLTLQKYLTN